MKKGHLDRWAAAAWIVSLPVLLLPVGDPDLFWHLSAARRIFEFAAVPRSDWLSFTMAGARWVDFEWLAQIIFYLIFLLNGLAGLLWFKAGMLVLAGSGVYALLSRCGLSSPVRAAGLAFWAAAMLPRSDIRTELFSHAAFAWLLTILEGRRLERKPPRAVPAFALAVVFFGLWANLHAGFLYGLILVALYAGADLLERKDCNLAWGLLGGALGAMFNPYGIGVYGVLLRHAREVGEVSRYIAEWGPLNLLRPEHWPCWLLLAGAAAALWSARRSGRRVWLLPATTLAVFALAALRHARLGAFFATAAVPLGLALAAKGGLIPKKKRTLELGAAVLLSAVALFTAGRGWSLGVFRRTHHTEYTPVLAARALEHPELLGRRLYHPAGWGGFLGFRFGPRQPVFQDGRYIFHPLLLEAGEAVASPEAWRDFLDRYGIEVAMMENLPLELPNRRVYPNGSSRQFLRPYYLSYMPRERWALVFWDRKALIFARRGAVSRAFLEKAEYRLWRPGDAAARADALRRGEIDPGRLAEERDRHRRELERLRAAAGTSH